jgi:hypothetical protein
MVTSQDACVQEEGACRRITCFECSNPGPGATTSQVEPCEKFNKRKIANILKSGLGKCQTLATETGMKST